MDAKDPSVLDRSYTYTRAQLSCIILFAINFLVSSQSAFAMVGLPHFALENGLPSGQLSALLSAFPLAAALSAFLAGPVSDFCGRRRLLLAGIACLAIALFLHPFCAGFGSLLAARIATGFACGTLYGLPSMFLSDHFALHRQRSLIGKSLSGYALGQTLGIPLGLVAIDQIGYRALNGSIGVLALALLAVSARALPRMAETFGGTRLRSRIGAYCADAARSIRSPQLRAIAGVSLISFVATSAFYVAVSLFFYQELSVGPAQLAPIYLAAGAAQALVMSSRIQETGGMRPAVLISFSFFASAAAIAAFAFGATSIEMAFPLFAIVAGSIAWRIPSFQTLVNNLGPKSQRGLRMSLTQTSSQIGRAVGASAAAALATSHSTVALLCGAALLLIPCGIAFALMDRIEPGRNGLNLESEPEATR